MDAGDFRAGMRGGTARWNAFTNLHPHFTPNSASLMDEEFDTNNTSNKQHPLSKLQSIKTEFDNITKDRNAIIQQN